MNRLSPRHASIYAVLIFLLTLAMGYLLPQYSIIAGGFLLVIFFTVFIESRSSTFIAAGGSLAVIITAYLFVDLPAENEILATQSLFNALLVVFTTYMVLHLKELYRSIRLDKTHMASLFENATEGIILTNKEGRIVLFNPAAERIFGYTASEITEEKIEKLIPRKYHDSHVKQREGFHRQPQNRVMGWGRDLFGVDKDNREIPVEVSLSHYRQNNETFVIAFVVDITHRKQIEQDMVRQQQELEAASVNIRKLNAELEAKVEERTVILREALMKLEQSQSELSDALDKERELNEIKSRFVSMASHEFRTPLSTVLSSVSLISKYTTTEDQPKRDKHINRIRESVRHLNEILEDFLSLGRLDEGKISIQKEEFNFRELFDDISEEVRGIIKPGQSINTDYNGDQFVYSDKKILRNMLINIVSNAIKFSDEGSDIGIRVSFDNGVATITVEDRGIGISKEDQEHLFTTFFRGKNAVNIQGTGLGLHIVKRYADHLGGNVHLQSELGIGTTVTLNIPVKK